MKRRAHVEYLSAASYDALLPERLPGDVLDEQQPFSLLVRENNRTPDAFRVVINATELRRQFGLVSFKMIVLDQDFAPASRPVDAAIDINKMWSGSLSLKARDRTFKTPQGFLVPYQDIDNTSLLETFESIDA